MLPRNALFFLSLIVFASILSLNFTLADTKSETIDNSNIEKFKTTRTALREVLEPIDAVVIMKAHIDSTSKQQLIQSKFDYLTGVNSHKNPKVFANSILIMSYRASFLLLDTKTTEEFNSLRTWVVKNCGYYENQVFQLTDDVVSTLKTYFYLNSLVLLQQTYAKADKVFVDNDLVDWARKFVKSPIFPDADEFAPNYLINKISRFKSKTEIAKYKKASEILEKSLQFTAQFLPELKPMPSGAILVDTKMVDEIKSKVFAWMAQIKINPVFNAKTKKLDGYKLVNMPKDKLFDTLNIKLGDIILAVNGKLPSFSTELETLMKTLSEDGGTLKVKIQRGDKTFEQIYYVVSTNAQSAIDANVFSHIFNKYTTKLGATASKLKLYRLVDGRFEQINDRVNSYDSVMLQASVNVENCKIVKKQTVNLVDDNISINTLETKSAQAVSIVREMLSKKSTFTKIQQKVKSECGVDVDFRHAGPQFIKLFPEEIRPIENCIYQIYFSLESYIFDINSIEINKIPTDQKTVKSKVVGNLRKLSNTFYAKFQNAGLTVSPEIYKTKNSAREYIAARVNEVSVGPFMTMPLKADDLILEINSTRICDCIETGLIDKIAKLDQNPYVATVHSAGEVVIVTTNSNFYKGFELEHLANLTDECFDYIIPMLDDAKYQNRFPMSNPAAMTASMISEFLKGMMFKPLPGMNHELDGYFVRSDKYLNRTDIVGILKNANSKHNVLIEIDIPYDFSKENGSLTSQNVNTLLGLGFGLCNILRTNPDVDILVHFYSQANYPINLYGASAQFFGQYENIVNIEFTIDPSVETLKTELADLNSAKPYLESFKAQINLAGLNLLEISQGIGLAQHTLAKLDTKEDLVIRFVIPADTKGNLELLKAARLISLIPSVINAKND